MSVSILYYKVTPERISSAQLSEQIARWSEELPTEKRLRINQLHQQNDKVMSLAGLQLLKAAMAEFPSIPFSLSQLQFPQQAKPFFSEALDFNISHSGSIACCIISDNHKVGIDIELQRDVKEATLNKYLNEATLPIMVQPGEDKKQAFFNVWTRYEAIIKAANHGSIFNMKDIQLEADGGLYQELFWYTYPLDIMPGNDSEKYTCHIACSDKLTADQITVKQIHEI